MCALWPRKIEEDDMTIINRLFYGLNQDISLIHPEHELLFNKEKRNNQK